MSRIPISDIDKKALHFVLGDNWATISYREIPVRVNAKVGYELLCATDLLTNGVRKIREYYLQYEAGRK